MKRLIILIIVIAVMFSNTTYANTESLPEQNVTISIVVNGELYCYCYIDSSNMEWISFGIMEWYSDSVNNGIYIIVWNGDINQDEQTIKRIINIL